MLICIKQHLSSIWSSIHKNVRNTEAELKKSVAYKKACIPINYSNGFSPITSYMAFLDTISTWYNVTV